ncbi:MAG: polysaccharide biosynthesis protein, partial [Clostridia bacterium]|nr:polysaccharide biosynthesis protein [Clostridia bacterium]
MAALIAVLAGNLEWTLKILWWYLANLALSYVFLILFRMYYFTFDTVGLIDTLKLVGVAMLTFATGCSYSPFLVGIWQQFVYTITFFSFVLAIRYSKRIYIMIKYSVTSRNRGKIRAMIIGGGNAGATLIREIQTTDKIDYNPVCVIDDDVAKVGKRIGNVKIVGTTEDIKKCAEKYAIEEILIAIPSAKKAEVKRIYEICKTTDCKVKTLPGIYQIVSGEASVAALREVQITDLLGREQIQVNLDEIMGYIEGQVVLVTGGGGSIGSELCRQIATHNPKQLIILDIYENNAYDIEQELKRKHPSLNLLALIASIRDKGKMEDVFTKYHPDIVFNAAAHKHVPLMETSPNEAVKNNVFGTLNVAKCADKFGVKVFVQISTDKAVNPTNIMGAPKRICEMIIQPIGRNSKNTKFVAVRFGNVLGSNGSVIPLFERQIAEGGPVTVTHKDIIRYFMTIPEAVSLVLQAGAYAQGGQIFVLDMGEPVKIYDLA